MAPKDREDIIDIPGVTPPPSWYESTAPQPKRRFLSVWFRCCHMYGRLYRNRDETAYEGRCPGCSAPVHALIGPDGTTRRLFEAR